MHFIIQIILGLFIGDFVIAFGHWFEDTYLSYCTNIPIFSSIAKDNALHHYFPRAVVSYSYLENISVTLPISLCAFIIIFCIFPRFVYVYKYLFVTTFTLIIFGNIFHKWEHMRDCECPQVVLALQKCGILIGHQHHKIHHQNPKYNYGVVFPCTNYLLDAIKFWRGLEFLIQKVFNIKPDHIYSYDKYISDVKDTQYHSISKNSCPPVLTMQEIQELKSNLSQYHLCI